MKVETSMLASLMYIQQGNINLMLTRGRPMARHSRNRQPNPLDNVYKCQDGLWVMLGEPQSTRYWTKFCAEFGLTHIEHDERFATEGARSKNTRELTAIVGEAVATRPRAEWVPILERIGMGFNVINRLDDLPTDPQVIENELIVPVQHPVLGEIKTTAIPVKFSARKPDYNPAPLAAEHTEQILSEMLGYSPERIQQLRTAGAI
jgi:crotonobetainyl-CoA:carnitine CoA-transferase CaiB-like acyl-CoA transferase